MSRPKSSKTRVRKVRTLFPISSTKAMFECCIAPKNRAIFIKCYPPDYQHGKVARYHKVPEQKDWSCIVSPDKRAVEIKSLFDAKRSAILYSGTKEECAAKCKEYMKEFWNLKRGKELSWFKQPKPGLTAQ